jgi:hypothetical protein
MGESLIIDDKKLQMPDFDDKEAAKIARPLKYAAIKKKSKNLPIQGHDRYPCRVPEFTA